MTAEQTIKSLVERLDAAEKRIGHLERDMAYLLNEEASAKDQTPKTKAKPNKFYDAEAVEDITEEIKEKLRAERGFRPRVQEPVESEQFNMQAVKEIMDEQRDEVVARDLVTTIYNGFAKNPSEPYTEVDAK